MHYLTTEHPFLFVSLFSNIQSNVYQFFVNFVCQLSLSHTPAPSPSYENNIDKYKIEARSLEQLRSSLMSVLLDFSIFLGI